jgi:hypothetical protein
LGRAIVVKGLLRIFGLAGVVLGVLGIVASFVMVGAMQVLLPWSIGLLPTGAILLGLAYGLELLEDLVLNTSIRASNPTGPLPPRR